MRHQRVDDSPKPRILVVDDHESNIVTLKAVLESLPVEIVTAHSGEEALREVLEDDFALILLDVHMPKLDGYETAHLIRGRERSRHIPIMFLTAVYGSPEFVTRGYCAGAVDYMVKPFDPTVLRSKVEVFIGLQLRAATLQAQVEQLRRVSAMQKEDLALAQDAARRLTTTLENIQLYEMAHQERVSPRNVGASDSNMVPSLLAGVHALVVEDDPDSSELVELVLRRFGAAVTCVANVSAALCVLAEHRPDVLVSDIGLPGEDGLTLIRRIREIQELANLPAIALSAYASRRDVREALAAGFQAHVAKPFEPNQLGKIIASVVNC